MLTTVLRQRSRRAVEAVAGCFLYVGVGPTHLTLLIPVVAWTAVTPLIALDRPIAAATLVALVFPLDAVDGAMARKRSTDSQWGRFIDVISDRLSDSALWAGIIVYSASRDPQTFILCVLAASSWHVVSQTTVAAQSIGAQISLGPFQRTERVTVVVVALLLLGFGFPAALPSMAAFLIAANAGTVVVRSHRTWLATQRSKEHLV